MRQRKAKVRWWSIDRGMSSCAFIVFFIVFFPTVYNFTNNTSTRQSSSKAKAIKDRILSKNINAKEKKRNRQQNAAAAATGTTTNLTSSPVKPSLTARWRASLASTKVFASAALRAKFKPDTATAKGKQKIKLKIPYKTFKKSKMYRMNNEIFRDDELEIGDVILVRWKNGRVGWPAMIVGIHCKSINIFTFG